ncbi:MAG: RagB/SusD family nutrient uptake outer membrane protein [Cyclobacteriaceae bacterium]
MKKYLNRYLSALLVLLIVSCTDLEETPVGVLSPDGYFQTPGDVEAAIFGAYGRMASETYYGRKLTLTLQLLSDMCDIGDRGTPARRQEINDFITESNNGMVSSFWPQSYAIISATNAAIAGADLLDAGAVTEEKRNELKAEARFARAFTYYHLVQLFGDIPYIDYVVNEPESVAELAKTSEADVYANIIADLEFAQQNLPMLHPSNVRTRPSKGTAYTMLASVYMTQGNWQQAYDNAKWVIDNAGELNYALVPDFQTLFIATEEDGLPEHIFALDFLGLQNGGGGENDDIMGAITGIRGADQNGWSVSVPSLAVYNNWDPRDYRKKVSIEDSTMVGGVLTPYTEYQQVQRPHIAKFARFPGNANTEGRYSDHNYVCFRYAEVLLIAAEALNEISGPTAEAMEYINQLRARARNWAGTMTNFPEDVAAGINQNDFRDLVLEERRLELAFEFKRWYDIKRRQLGEEAFTAPTSLEPHANFDPGKHYLLPLPQDELDRNPNLAPQNPGY